MLRRALFVPLSPFRPVHQTHRQPFCRAPLQMALDAAKIRSARFPTTVEHATELLGTSKPVPVSNCNLLRELLKTSDGARGVMVAALSQEELPHCEQPLDDRFTSLVVDAASMHNEIGKMLQKLMVTNVVMSNAMTVTYKTKGDTESLKGSELTARRAQNLLRVMSGNEEVNNVAREFIRGLNQNEGQFRNFSVKWGYGEGEKKQAVKALKETLANI